MEDGLGHRDPPLPQEHLSPLPQGDELGQIPHPQLRALEIQDQVGLVHPCLAGGRPEQLLEQRGALGQTGVGQIDPRPCHACLEQLIDDVPFGAGVAQSSIIFHSVLLAAVFFPIMRAGALEVNENLHRIPAEAHACPLREDWSGECPNRGPRSKMGGMGSSETAAQDRPSPTRLGCSVLLTSE